MSVRSLLLSLFFLKIVISFVLKYFSYHGNDSLELKEQILVYFTEEDIKNGIEYSRSRFFGSIASSIIQFIFAGVLVFSPIASKIEDYFSIKTSGKFYFTALLFILTYYIAEFIISFPFSYYFGYVIEHRFGFSNMTLSDWLLYESKSFLIGIVMTVLIGLVSLFILKEFQNYWKIMLPAGSVLFGLIFSILFPVLITPLFYEYSEIQEGSLKTKINELASKSNISFSKIYVINESKYSGHTNAYFTGWGENRKIFLYDTLIKKNTEEEVISILGHEIGHWVHNHQIKGIFISALGLLVLCFLFAIIFDKTKQEGLIPLKEIYSPSSLPFIFLIVSFFSLLTSPFESYLSRSDETEADLEALILTNDKKSFISSEIKIARDNKARLDPHPLIVKMYYSHPPTIDRIKLAEQYREK